jgi:hypothetical protein
MSTPTEPDLNAMWSGAGRDTLVVGGAGAPSGNSSKAGPRARPPTWCSSRTLSTSSIGDEMLTVSSGPGVSLAE